MKHLEQPLLLWHPVHGYIPEADSEEDLHPPTKPPKLLPPRGDAHRQRRLAYSKGYHAAKRGAEPTDPEDDEYMRGYTAGAS